MSRELNAALWLFTLLGLIFYGLFTDKITVQTGIICNLMIVCTGIILIFIRYEKK